FLDLGFLPTSADPNTLMGGNPSVACTNADLFHFAALYVGLTETGMVSGVAVSHSTNGGAVWGEPVVAVSKGASQHTLARDWVAADLAQPNNVYVTYTDFGAFGSDPSCVSYPTTIELVRSTDAGATWGAPVALDSTCGFDAFVQAPQVVVGNAGEVLVAWE